jgi:hypothetical protein
VSFRRLYSRLLMLFDRLIFKDSYDYRAALRQLSSDLSWPATWTPWPRRFRSRCANS